MASNRPVRPTMSSADDAKTSNVEKYYPLRESRDTNTSSRLEQIQSEIDTLFKYNEYAIISKDMFPVLSRELPTLWAMIEEGGFKYWEKRDQDMLTKMITLQMGVVNHTRSLDDAEKEMGVNLAERYIYPKTGGHTR